MFIRYKQYAYSRGATLLSALGSTFLTCGIGGLVLVLCMRILPALLNGGAMDWSSVPLILGICGVLALLGWLLAFWSRRVAERAYEKFLEKREKARNDQPARQQERQEPVRFTLRNQNGEKPVSRVGEIQEFLAIMLEDEAQFAVLNASRALNGIHFVQAALTNGETQVQIGLEKAPPLVDPENRLVPNVYCRWCGGEELRKIFLDFYHGTFQPDLTEYKPLERG